MFDGGNGGGKGGRKGRGIKRIQYGRINVSLRDKTQTWMMTLTCQCEQAALLLFSEWLVLLLDEGSPSSEHVAVAKKGCISIIITSEKSELSQGASLSGCDACPSVRPRCG